MIVHINGYPGVGKETVARALVAIIGARLVDNHSIINCAYVCTEPRTEGYYRVLRQLTEVVHQALADRPATEIQVFTNALAETIPNDLHRFAAVADLARRRGVPFIPVLLIADRAILLDRCLSPERAARQKLIDPAVLSEIAARHTLLHPSEEPFGLVLDTDRLSAEASAQIIANHINAVRSTEIAHV
jgi:predicted kinase